MILIAYMTTVCDCESRDLRFHIKGDTLAVVCESCGHTESASHMRARNLEDLPQTTKAACTRGPLVEYLENVETKEIPGRE